MKKEELKKKENELFIGFLIKNNFTVNNTGFMNSFYSIQKNKKKEDYSSGNFTCYYANDYLEESLDGVSKNETMMFLSYLIDKNEHEVCLRQAIRKTPRKNSYEYDESVSLIIDCISKNKDLLFKYISRSNFLENNWGNLEKNKVFNTIDSQEQRKLLFDLICNSKSFASIDTQKGVYNLIQKHIKQHDKFNHYFSKIEVKNTASEDLIEEQKDFKAFKLSFDKAKLNSVNLKSDMQNSDIVQGIKITLEKLKEQNKELEIEFINLELDDINKYAIKIICSEKNLEFNKFLCSAIVNKVARFNEFKEVIVFLNDISFNSWFNEKKSIFLYNKINNEESFQNTVNNGIRKNFKI